MPDFKRILVTSALPYANGPIHLGHLAGAYFPSDMFVRYHRLRGHDVIHICGSDEHGVPIMLRARDENVPPQQIVDRYHKRNKASFAEFGIGFDYYGRTSSQKHHETSQDFFRTLAKKKVFSLKQEKQLYDPEAKMFLADRFVRGTCPSCSYEEAYGDQCENCGTALSPTDLINPRSAVTNAEPVLKESTHWYLKLEDMQKDLEQWIGGHPEWKSNVLGQIRSWLDSGLRDRAVTRDLPWGVPVPADVAEANGVDASGKVLYVWFDAPIGYISATREWAEEKGDPALWKTYWQDEETRLVHFIGKDNIVFHCIMFPAMLQRHGEYVLPDNVPANEFLNLEGGKLSTSRNYAVWLEEYLQNFDADSLRYWLAGNLPETKDTDFSWKEFQARHNNELADILGNFVNRTVTFAHRHFEGKVPPRGDLNEMDKKQLGILAAAPRKIGGYIDGFQMRQATRAMMDVARFANKYFNDAKPWETIKADRDRCATTINLCLETIRSLAVLFEPVIPFTTPKMKQLLHIKEETGNIWDVVGEPGLEEGQPLGKPQILFVKLEDAAVQREIDKLQSVSNKQEKDSPAANDVGRGSSDPPGEKEAASVPDATLVSIDEFSRLDLRVAEVLAAERVKKTDKLVKLQIRIGAEERQIVAGIAAQYEPEELVGKSIIVVANLQPVTIRGEESRGMLLAASDGDRLSLLTTVEKIATGAKIR